MFDRGITEADVHTALSVGLIIENYPTAIPGLFESSGFIIELLDYLSGDRAALIRKFAGEIHANEISILPYYIAYLNIEQTFAD